MDTVAALIRRDDKFFLTKETEDEDFSEISGEINRGKTLREALRQKVREEAEIEIEIQEKIERVNKSDDRKHWYLVEEIEPSEENPDPDKIESDEGQWIELHETEKMRSHTAEFSEKHKEKLV